MQFLIHSVKFTLKILITLLDWKYIFYLSLLKEISDKLFKIHLRKSLFQSYTTKLEALISGFVFTEKIHTGQKITYS